MGLYNLVRSKGYKNFMAKLYGIGAAVVILGALFKILHLQGANIMLIAGMGTEAIIFIFSAFEPLHVEYNWALVYPELAIGNEEELKPVTKKAKKEAPTGTVTQQLDKMLEEAKIGPELIESLATGMRNLSENAKKSLALLMLQLQQMVISLILLKLVKRQKIFLFNMKRQLMH